MSNHRNNLLEYVIDEYKFSRINWEKTRYANNFEIPDLEFRCLLSNLASYCPKSSWVAEFDCSEGFDVHDSICVYIEKTISHIKVINDKFLKVSMLKTMKKDSKFLEWFHFNYLVTDSSIKHFINFYDKKKYVYLIEKEDLKSYLEKRITEFLPTDNFYSNYYNTLANLFPSTETQITSSERPSKAFSILLCATLRKIFNKVDIEEYLDKRKNESSRSDFIGKLIKKLEIEHQNNQLDRKTVQKWVDEALNYINSFSE